MLAVTDFSQDILHDWQEKQFSGKTRYALVREAEGSCIRAQSKASASGLFRKIRVNLDKTPYLYWRWKIDQPLNNRSEREKGGDDFVARIYLIISGGLFFWNTRAINYVWASHESVDAAWDNPYTANSVMLAVESGTEHAGQWRQYRRDVRQDMNRVFGKDFSHIDAVAIMTDTDNTGQSATACYGSISFRAD